MRGALGDKNIDFVAVNDLRAPIKLAILLKYERFWQPPREGRGPRRTPSPSMATSQCCCSPRLPASSSGRIFWGVGTSVLASTRHVHQPRTGRQVARAATKVVITAQAKGPDFSAAFGGENELYDHASTTQLERLVHEQLSGPLAKVPCNRPRPQEGWMNDDPLVQPPIRQLSTCRTRNLRSARAAARCR